MRPSVLLRDAVLSPDRLYRYKLYRWWAEYPLRWVLWVMLNPSIADGSVDDRTVMRCIDFSRTWGFDGLMIGNTQALIATDPHELQRALDPVGSSNLAHLREMSDDADLIVCAWGSHKSVTPPLVGRTLRAIGKRTYCLGRTANNSPRHPLYLRADTQLVAFN